MVQNLEDMGLTMIPFGQGYKDMSPPSKELFKLMMEGRIQHGGQPVLKWMSQNVVMRQDPAGNIKPDKGKSIEKIDGIVAFIMGIDRYIRHQNNDSSIYDERGILSFLKKQEINLFIYLLTLSFFHDKIFLEIKT